VTRAPTANVRGKAIRLETLASMDVTTADPVA
jgi:hypothetical protein